MRHRRTQHREEQRPSPTVRQGGGCVGSKRNCSLVAFVHIDTYTSKYGDDAREGELCRLSHSSRAYCIYHPGEGHCFRNMERAFPVLENLPCFHLPTNGPDYLDDDEEAYVRDVVGYTSFLDPVVFYNTEETTPVQLARLHTRIMPRENQGIIMTDGASLPEGDGISSPGADGSSEATGISLFWVYRIITTWEYWIIIDRGCRSIIK